MTGSKFSFEYLSDLTKKYLKFLKIMAPKMAQFQKGCIFIIQKAV